MTTGRGNLMVQIMINKNNTGFTILEVMAALVFLAVGLLGIAGLHHASIFGNQSANYMTRAVNLAEDKLEELKRLDFADPELADTDGIDTDVGTDIKANPILFTDPDHLNDSPDSGLIRVWNVADSTPAIGLKTVTVIVGWQVKRWHYVALSTYIRNE
ncbi:MAG: type IV pilus modification PilV family protein [bacterium]